MSPSYLPCFPYSLLCVGASFWLGFWCLGRMFLMFGEKSADSLNSAPFPKLERNACFWKEKYIWLYLRNTVCSRSEKYEKAEMSRFVKFCRSFCGGQQHSSCLPESFYPTHDLFATGIARYFSLLIQPNAKVLLNWQKLVSMAQNLLLKLIIGARHFSNT